MINVHVIVPTITEFDSLEKLQHLSDSELSLTQSHLQTGPASIESEYDELLAGPGTVINALEAERSGADAIVVSCMGDPALHQLREAVSIPVLGPGETAMHYAAMCGRRFTIIATLERRRGTYVDHAKCYGVESKLASVRAAGTQVLDIGDSADIKDKLLDQSLRAIKEDDADVIILACAGFSYLNKQIESELKEIGHPVTVIDAMPLTVLTAATMARVELSHSKRAFPSPPQKKVLGYGILDQEFHLDSM